jgi:hypothetical protein
LKAAFEGIGKYCCNRLPLLCFGNPSETLGSLIICDANQDAWASIMVYIIPKQDGTFSLDTPLIPNEDLTELIECIESKLQRAVTLIPIKLAGGRFSKTQKKLSSTYRERSAILCAIEDFYNSITGQVFIVNDNKNCAANWTVDNLSGTELGQFIRLQGIPHQYIWLKRTGVPKYADWLARHVAVEQSQLINCNAAHVEESMDEDDVVVSPEVNSILKEELINGYMSDTTSVYHSVKICDIYDYLKTDTAVTRNGVPDTDSSSKLSLISTRFIYDDGILKFKTIHGYKIMVPSISTKQIMVDGSLQPLRAALLHLHHNTFLHAGSHRLYASLSRAWYWPGMIKDVKRFIRGCLVCNLRREEYGAAGNSDLASPTADAALVFETIMIDYFSLNGINVLLVIDTFSHFMFSYRVEPADAINTAKCLFDLMCTIGIPNVIMCDNGSTFKNILMEEMTKMFNIKLNFSFTYHPRRNGLVEVLVKEIKTGIKAGMLEFGPDHDFDTLLKMATLSHNRSPFAYANISPYEIVFNRSCARIDPVLETWEPETKFNKSLRECWRHVR